MDAIQLEVRAAGRWRGAPGKTSLPEVERLSATLDRGHKGRSKVPEQCTQGQAICGRWSVSGLKMGTPVPWVASRRVEVGGEGGAAPSGQSGRRDLIPAHVLICINCSLQK